jgi:hypothetical protein
MLSGDRWRAVGPRLWYDGALRRGPEYSHLSRVCGIQRGKGAPSRRGPCGHPLVVVAQAVAVQWRASVSSLPPPPQGLTSYGEAWRHDDLPADFLGFPHH